MMAEFITVFGLCVYLMVVCAVVFTLSYLGTRLFIALLYVYEKRQRDRKSSFLALFLKGFKKGKF